MSQPSLRTASRWSVPSGVLLAIVLLPVWSACGGGSTEADEGAAPASASSWEDLVNGDPSPAGSIEPDVFHPDGDVQPPPRKGGRVIVHLSTLPKNMNHMVENSAATRRMLRETHEMLVERHWETWEHRPVLSKPWVAEDTLVLAGGRGEDKGNIHYGRVEELEDEYRVTPLSRGNPLDGPLEVPKDEVESVERETVFTFELRDGVKWQDGHPLDAADVLFSYESYLNPAVDCDSVRFQYEKIVHAEAVDDRAVRFFFGEQYFLALDTFTDLTILPAHVYDLSDPDNPDADPEADEQTQGKFVNEHERNRMWLGLGPYRVTEWTNQWIDAERWDGYFDSENGGHIDRIRWRHIPGDDAAKQAVLNGEVDFWDRLRSEDYYGEFVQSDAFQERYYKALQSYTYFGYTAWNCRKPKFSDPKVRQALNMCFDWESYIPNVYNGLASRITGSQYYFSPYYDRSIEPIPFDVDGAQELLADAGWYDHDDNGVIDKDGVEMRIQFLMPTGNKASALFGQKFMENLAELGIELDIATREWAAFLERLDEREFDCANLAWIPDLVSDPEQLWHSKWAGKSSSNNAGLEDERVDELIEQIQVELDDERRKELLSKLQARIYELQPYMFAVNQPKKLAVSKRIRNFKMYANDPGYRIREWYLVDPGEDTVEASAPKEEGSR